jgi:Cu+-exporting ATPase
MKYFAPLFTSFLLLILFVSCKPETKTELKTVPKKSSSIAKEPKIAQFTIEGMTCAIGCAKTIQTELSELEGVQEAVVDFDTKKAIVSFDATIQSEESIKKTVMAAAGGATYSVVNMVITKKQ